MRTTLAVLGIFIAQVALYAQHNDIYTHGQGDGFSIALYVQSASTSNNAIFNHGNGDGQSVLSFKESAQNLSNTIFTHGKGDGFDIEHYIEPSVARGNAIFKHGPSDGFDAEAFNESLFVLSNSIFKHSAGDGFDVEYYVTAALQSNSIFKHSSSDGFDLKTFTDIPGLLANNAIFNHGTGDGFAFLVYQAEVPNGRKSMMDEPTTALLISESRIQLSPNPSHGIFTIFWPSSMQTGRKIKILNMLGESVFEGHFLEVSKELDISRAGAGLFLVYCIEHEKIIAHKIIIL